ncbi:MAG: alpha-glucosidase C-terminal domain-containing protein, partial [Sphaerochaetaceae bacterium]|nr:alpha-glucosidase C-terminal domain-containing protein [Sphaerochaetaceae bacterium]
FLIRRTHGDDELLCFSSFSDYEETVRTNCLIGTYRDLFTGREVVPGWGFKMKPHEYLWCKKISD